MQIASITIGAFLFSLLAAYFLGRRISENKILKGWLKKGVEREKKNEKITNLYRDVDRLVFNKLHATTRPDNKATKARGGSDDNR